MLFIFQNQKQHNKKRNINDQQQGVYRFEYTNLSIMSTGNTESAIDEKESNPKQVPVSENEKKCADTEDDTTCDDTHLDKQAQPDMTNEEQRNQDHNAQREVGDDNKTQNDTNNTTDNTEGGTNVGVCDNHTTRKETTLAEQMIRILDENKEAERDLEFSKLFNSQVDLLHKSIMQLSNSNDKTQDKVLLKEALDVQEKSCIIMQRCINVTQKITEDPDQSTTTDEIAQKKKEAMNIIFEFYAVHESLKGRTMSD